MATVPNNYTALQVEAFKRGAAFAMGIRYAQRIKTANDEFKENEHPRDKNGRFKGNNSNKGSFQAHGAPVFKEYLNTHPELKGASFTKKVTAYMRDNYAGKIIDHPAGLKGCNKLIYSNAACKETASHMTERKLKALPYLSYIYKTGREIAQSKDYHQINTAVIHYTGKVLKIDGVFYIVTLVSKQSGKTAEFSHYVVDKVDELKH